MYDTGAFGGDKKSNENDDDKTDDMIERVEGNSDDENPKPAELLNNGEKLMLLQDLFVTETESVFRYAERIWYIDQIVRERFNQKSLYEMALKEDIPWRQCEKWIREKILSYLQENGRILNA